MTTEQSYIPGMCNINQAEVAYRKKAMWFGIGLTLLLLAPMVLLDLSVWFRLLLFVPIFIAAIGYLQTKNRFCVAYAAAGKQNATDGSDEAIEVADKEAHEADRKKAHTMNTQAFVASIILTALLLLIPSVTL